MANEVSMAQVDWKDVKGTVSNIMSVGSGGRGGHFYAITFSYMVDGHYYGGEFTVASAQNYTEGGTIQVKYNPENPEQNNLDGRGGVGLWINWAMTVGGAAFIVYLIVIRGCSTH
jgi:hypothetical protein